MGPNSPWRHVAKAFGNQRTYGQKITGLSFYTCKVGVIMSPHSTAEWIKRACQALKSTVYTVKS